MFRRPRLSSVGPHFLVGTFSAIQALQTTTVAHSVTTPLSQKRTPRSNVSRSHTRATVEARKVSFEAPQPTAPSSELPLPPGVPMPPPPPPAIMHAPAASHAGPPPPPGALFSGQITHYQSAFIFRSQLRPWAPTLLVVFPLCPFISFVVSLCSRET